ncbi:aminoglycoside 2'-N-acetyltransferase [Streptomyces sp. Tue6028]|uniref:GNAT family N-acetyltransferase n=1 Tax=Streptomyces sp. Tue6028 TaxID=2036037 RepID=UPI000BB33BC4|nr:GNAT family N-acetyltransferase [Streptomyces sp. Tue6028]PBC61065.1 aminoglycoside 2'-N-acetyltransferase [Streptomyces sp. Tue6028]
MTLRLRTAHTADLAPGDLRAVRELLDAAFDGGFDDHDWDHGLGGLHVLVHDARGLAAHGSVVQRRVLHRGRSLRTGYVEAVGVRADVRRTGLGGRVMAELERIVDGAYALGALSASEEGAALYAARGWRVWPGRICVLGPDGVVRLPEEEGTTFVRPSSAGPLDPAHELVLDWRDGDVL